VWEVKKSNGTNGSAMKSKPKSKPKVVIDLDDRDDTGPIEAKKVFKAKEEELPKEKQGWWISEQERLRKLDDQIARLRALRLERDTTQIKQKR
jgi:hypothetical protein